MPVFMPTIGFAKASDHVCIWRIADGEPGITLLSLHTLTHASSAGGTKQHPKWRNTLL